MALQSRKGGNVSNSASSVSASVQSMTHEEVGTTNAGSDVEMTATNNNGGGRKTATRSRNENDPTPALERLTVNAISREIDSSFETDLVAAGKDDTGNVNYNSSMIQQDRMEAEQHWKDSPYAVGIVAPSWHDEIRHRQNRAVAECMTPRGGPSYIRRLRTANVCCDACHTEDVNEEENLCCCLILSGWVCGGGRSFNCCKARRIGNMIILKERPYDASIKDGTATDDISDDDEEAGADEHDNEESDLVAGESTNKLIRRGKKKKKFTPPTPPTELICVVGPYWPVLLCLTYPLVLGVSGATLILAIPHQHIAVKILWFIMTPLLIYMLFNVSCSDPGLLLRHREDPSQVMPEYASRRGGMRGGAWRWSEKAQSYHPRSAIYDPDCAVIVEGYDHVCPWTGTAIGKKNMWAFQGFVGSVFFCLMMDVLLLTGAIGGPNGMFSPPGSTVSAAAAAAAARATAKAAAANST